MANLDAGTKHFLSLIRKDKKSDGWTTVSSILCGLVEKMPSELVVFEKTDAGGRAKLTEKGETVLDWI